jgi:uncharacterized membrane protein YqjE
MTEQGTTGPAARLLQSLVRMAGTITGVVETRIDLLATEISEDAQRALQAVLWALVAVMAGFAGLMFTAGLVVMAFWDTHRFAATLAVIAAFLGVAAWATHVSRSRMREKPRILDATLTELKRDVASLRGER